MSNYISKKITFVGFILSVMVVYGHAINYKVYSCLELSKLGMFWTSIQKFLAVFLLIPVPLFYVISGYLFFRNYSLNKTCEKWKSRFFTLVLPYLIWNFISFLFYFLLTNIPILANSINREPVSFSVKALIEILNGNYNVLWFIKVLLIFILFAPFILILSKYYYTWGGVLVLVFLTNLILKKYLDWNSPCYECFFFILGAGAGIHFKQIEEYRANKKISIFSLLAMIIISLLVFPFINDSFTYIKILILTPLIIFFWLFMDIVNWENKNTKYFSISFFIYCTHSIILESIEKIWLILFGNTIFGSITDFMLSPIITLLIIFLFAYILKKVKPLWNVCTGSR